MATNYRQARVQSTKDEVTQIKTYTVIWWVADDSLIDTIGAASYGGVPLKSRKSDNWDANTVDAGFQVDLFYEGQSADDEGKAGESWDLSDSSFREIPVEEHPGIDELLETYGGVIIDGKVNWIDNFEFADDLNLGLSDTDAQGRTRHPFFGQKTIMVWHGVARRTYYASDINSAYEGVATIFDQLPGEGPRIDFQYGENWIKRMPKPRQSGDGWEVTEEYWLSKPGGWKQGLDTLTISPGSSGGGGGLRTGSL